MMITFVSSILGIIRCVYTPLSLMVSMSNATKLIDEVKILLGAPKEEDKG